MERILVSWSGGKDSALAVHEILKNNNLEVAALLTTVTKEYDRISMHGVQSSLLCRQADALGFKLEQAVISKDASNAEYELRTAEVMSRYQEEGVTSAMFGDIFLEDLRKYREERMSQIGMHSIFPIWKVETGQLARRFIDLGFKAITTCVDTTVLGKEFVGRELDERFFQDLPGGVDPCGENGEFHSFVYDGPIFKKPLSIRIGEKVLRDNRFYYCDLLEA